MKKLVLPLFLLLSATMGCKINKKAAMPIENFMMDELLVQPKVVKPTKYQPMPTQVADLIHTKLQLSFDYQKQWVLGSAHLWIKPYAKSIHEISLNAQGFELKKVALISKKDTLIKEFSYDGKKLNIVLGFGLNPTDTAQIWIEYIAKQVEKRAQLMEQTDIVNRPKRQSKILPANATVKANNQVSDFLNQPLLHTKNLSSHDSIAWDMAKRQFDLGNIDSAQIYISPLFGNSFWREDAEWLQLKIYEKQNKQEAYAALLKIIANQDGKYKKDALLLLK